jgi:hypothetical protein
VSSQWSAASVGYFIQSVLQDAFIFAKARQGLEVARESLALRRYLGLLLNAARHRVKGKAMIESKANKFLALYLVPGSVMADWAKTDPETKKAAEQKMQTEWRKWMGEHSKMVTLTEAGGKIARGRCEVLPKSPTSANSAVIDRSDGSQVDR